MSNHDISYLDNEDDAKAKLDKRAKSLKEEYESSFDSEEQLVNSLLHIKSKIDINLDTIQIDDIVTSTFKKISREKTIVGLTGIIGEWGVVSPIHVLKLEDDDSYLLLEGFRRIFGALRNGKSEIVAMVWDFSDKEEGKEMANILSLMLNRSERFSSSELWAQMQILEQVNDLGPGLIEYLLQMHAGDAMKLKDVMLSDSEYAEIREKLMNGEYSIEVAYKKLCNERKKENRLAKEDNIVIESASTDIENVSDEQKLGVDEVMDLLELTDENVEDMDLEDLDRSEEVRGVAEVQDVHDRKPIDPKIKQNTMIRDGFKCRCCGLGGHEGWAGVMVYHHVIPVFLGGEDSESNGATLCSNCHLSVHLYSFGKISVGFDKLNETDKKTFKNIFKFGNIIIEGMKRTKMSKDVAYKADSGSRRHLYPGEGLKDNREVLKKLGNTVTEDDEDEIEIVE